MVLLKKIKSNFENLFVNPVKSQIIGSIVEQMITYQTIWSNIKISMRNLNFLKKYYFSNLINVKKKKNQWAILIQLHKWSN